MTEPASNPASQDKRERSPLDPELPFAMKPRIERAVADQQLQTFVNRAAHGKNTGRLASFQETFGERTDELRRHAGAIKQHTLAHLDHYLGRFIDQAEAAGVQVHFAKDDVQAREIALEIAQRESCRLCVKSKSMVTEEVHLLPALEAAGVETIETDLGEFIVQLDDDAPSHIVTPMIHKDRTSVARAFVRELGADYTEDPEELTRIARAHMRKKFEQADLGISGANFLVADTGALVLCTNEGNGGLSTALPRVHIAFAGIEKVIPSQAHLAVFLKLLARSSTAQPLTVYTTVIRGPRRADEPDGPEQAHLILLDNGRTELLADESRELLRCIRCGACLNACPVYRKVGGGHAYGAVYSGPIGAAITPLFKGLENYPDLPQASSLCNACYEVCPVHIDLPRHLIRLRRELVGRKAMPGLDRFLYRAWAAAYQRGWTYRLSAWLQRRMLRALGKNTGGVRPYADHRWVERGPGQLGAWTQHRDLPSPPSRSFRQWWGERRGGGS
ncbi:MAG: LutB/LldF family L-lactate oxidation iron-sulfur protein [Phycisphaerales bacterium JB038]